MLKGVNIFLQEAKREIVIGPYKYVKQLSSSKDISICNFHKWKNKIISAINDKTNNLQIKIIPRKVNTAFNDCDDMTNVKQLLCNFVLY